MQGRMKVTLLRFMAILQVWWSPLAPSPFPEHIVKKYAGMGMAIVGWEIDQVRKGTGPNGEDESVPISARCVFSYVVCMVRACLVDV